MYRNSLLESSNSRNNNKVDATRYEHIAQLPARVHVLPGPCKLRMTGFESFRWLHCILLQRPVLACRWGRHHVDSASWALAPQVCVLA
jgi:hypothetical protein